MHLLVARVLCDALQHQPAAALALSVPRLPACQLDLVRHGRRRGDDVRAVLLLQALQEDLQVQRAQEAAPSHPGRCGQRVR